MTLKPDTQINGLIATNITAKGFDVPDVMIGVSARPFSKSFSSHVQQMGRVMRPAEGKEFCVWLDQQNSGQLSALEISGTTSTVTASLFSMTARRSQRRNRPPRRKKRRAARSVVRCGPGGVGYVYPLRTRSRQRRNEVI